MTFTTELEWRAAMMVAHPDRGGDSSTFAKLSAARDEWRQNVRPCQTCREPLPKNRKTFCSQYCKRAAVRVIRPKRRLESARRTMCRWCGTPDAMLTGLQLRERRERAGLSQHAFARRVGVTAGYVSLVERERRRCSATMRRAYAALAGLLDEQGKMRDGSAGYGTA